MNKEVRHPEQNPKNGETSSKYVFYRKPSIKKKAPVVKQTKTSINRILKANPLLMYEQELQENIDKLKKPSESLEDKKVNSKEKNPQAELKNSNTRRRLGSIISSNLTQEHKGANISKPSPIIFNHSVLVSSTICERKHKRNDAQKQKKVSETNSNQEDKSKKIERKPKQSLRRSLSAQHFDQKKGLLRTDSEKSLVKVTHSYSTSDINKEANDNCFTKRMSPLQESSRETSLIFKTPSAYERRSIANTPLSAAGLRRSIYRPNTPLPSLHELQKRLNDWLAKRGKSISLFHHLKSFDVPKTVIDEEDKENVETNEYFEKGSYEDLNIVTNGNSDNELNSTVTISDNIDCVAKSALADLLNLIHDGYPLNHCECWLHLIKDKYSQLQEEPEYWECRAAIEESRGNISNAVECYKTAIIQGAQVQEVDKSLDVLLQKFSLLNINAENAANEKVTKERERIVKDARNIFKSSIIKFAVQEKKMKKNNEIKLVATPVRRSARLSRSGYTSTPGIKICSTLNELDNRAELNFQPNKALN